MAFEITTMGQADQAAWQLALSVPGIMRVTISAADINSLFTTPKLIVPAPGPGKFINVISLVGRLKFVANPFFSPDIADVFLQYGETGGNPADDQRVAATFHGSDEPFSDSGDTSYIATLPAKIYLDFAVDTGLYLTRATSDLQFGDGEVTLIITYSVESNE